MHRLVRTISPLVGSFAVTAAVVATAALAPLDRAACLGSTVAVRR
jgi:hypothetical protein